jgi:hypothetical protein
VPFSSTIPWDAPSDHHTTGNAIWQCYARFWLNCLGSSALAKFAISVASGNPTAVACGKMNFEPRCFAIVDSNGPIKIELTRTQPR